MVHGRDPHERGGGDARREPEHAALLGAALRLPRAAAQRRRPPAVRPRPRSRRCARRSRRPRTSRRRSPLARDRGAGPASPSRLRGALQRFDEGEADRVLEESLAVRSVERTVEEVLLPGSTRSTRTRPRPALRLALGDRLAGRGRSASRRRATREEAVVVFDSSAPGDADGLHAQALELALRRRGLRTLTLARDARPRAPGARAARRRPARRRAHGPPRVARRARAASSTRRAATAAPVGGLRLPRRAARDGREHGRARSPRKPLAAAERIVGGARRPRRPSRPPRRSRAVERSDTLRVRRAAR